MEIEFNELNAQLRGMWNLLTTICDDISPEVTEKILNKIREVESFKIEKFSEILKKRQRGHEDE